MAGHEDSKPSPTISLLTDFGLMDPYVAEMKAVILSTCPKAAIIDISHLVEKFNIRMGAFLLASAAPSFPAGSIHVAVVDPGVGSERRPIVIEARRNLYVGPDNGLLIPAAEAEGMLKVCEVVNHKLMRGDVSATFHGRDIFSPVAAHLANGKHLSDLGTPIDDPVLLDIPVPEKTAGGWRGQVILVDNFGNLSTNLTGIQLSGLGNLRVRIAGELILGLTRTFGDAPAGSLVALIGEADDLSIAVVNGSAARRLGVGAGEPLEVLGD